MPGDYIVRFASAVALPTLRRHAAKEALQRHILRDLTREGLLRNVAFIGGTSLRLLHNLPRYSEDLDFVRTGGSIDREKWARAIRESVQRIGAVPHIQTNETKVDARVEKRSLTIYLAAVSQAWEQVVRGGSLQISFELDLDPPCNIEMDTRPMSVDDDTVDVPTLSLPSLMAGKLHILLTRRDREKGRDWFDYRWYRQKEILPNIQQLESAILQTAEGPPARFWTSCLRQRAKEVNWSLIQSDVSPFLESATEVNSLNRLALEQVTPWPDFSTVREALANEAPLNAPDAFWADVDMAETEGELEAILLKREIEERQDRANPNASKPEASELPPPDHSPPTRR